MPRAQCRVLLAQGDEPGDECCQCAPLRRSGHAPIVPGSFVVLTISIVIAALSASEFVAAEQHRGAVREHHRCEHGARDAAAELENCLVICRPFDAPIGGIILAMTVLIAFAICLVVPRGIADHIRERKAVVGGDVVDRGPRPAGMPIETQIARAREAGGQFRSLARIPAPEAPRAVAKAIVPLGKSRWMTAELIATGPHVPRLRDELHAREYRILAHR